MKKKHVILAAYIFLLIPLTMAIFGIEGKYCIAAYIFSLLICGIVYNKIKDNKNDETMTENDNNKNDAKVNSVATEYLGMDAKDLCLQLLQKMNVKVEKEEDDENSFIFEYKGERMSFKASSDGHFVLLYDTFWKKFPATNLEMVTLARKTVNRTNIEYNGFKLLYTFAEDTMWIHSNNFFLLVPEIPHVEEFFKSVLDNFLYAHKAFDEAMYELMKEEGESNKSEE